MSCENFGPGGQACRTVQVITPDPTLLTGTVSGSTDPSIDEFGSTPITGPVMAVTFTVPKATENYRFEYLYVDAQGITVNPGIVSPVVVASNRFGFGVEFAGSAPATGYVLHWRVFVVDVITEVFIDAPEVIRIALPVNQRVFTVNFINQRSNVIYGFDELRVENLADSPSTQRIILVQVAAKFLWGFTIGINPVANTTNYFLVARTP